LCPLFLSVGYKAAKLEICKRYKASAVVLCLRGTWIDENIKLFSAATSVNHLIKGMMFADLDLPLCNIATVAELSHINTNNPLFFPQMAA
jgi:hypothetical protein